jgi:hypothetical protein
MHAAAPKPNPLLQTVATAAGENEADGDRADDGAAPAAWTTASRVDPAGWVRRPAAGPAGGGGGGGGDSLPLASEVLLLPDGKKTVTASLALGLATKGGALPIEEEYSCDELIEAVGFGLFQWQLLAVCGLCWMADGMEMMLISFISLAVQCDFETTDVELTFLTTSVFAGMMVGSLCWGVLADAYGRRLGFIATSIFCLCFGISSAFAPSFFWLVLARFGVGIGVGGVPIAFSLNQEFMPVAQRGPVGMLLSLFWSVGALLEAALAWSIMPNLEWGGDDPSGGGWRWLTLISAAPLALLLLCWPFLPESPQYLCAHGRTKDARAVLRRAARWNGTSLPAGALLVSSASAPGQRKSLDQSLLSKGKGGGLKAKARLKAAAKDRLG